MVSVLLLPFLEKALEYGSYLQHDSDVMYLRKYRAFKFEGSAGEGSVAGRHFRVLIMPF